MINARSIRAAMALRGLRRRELAQKLNITEQYLSLIINGKRKADVKRKELEAALAPALEKLQEAV